MRAALALACASILWGSALPALQDEPVAESRQIMGTLCQVQVYDSDRTRARAAGIAALDEMARVDRLLSNYRPDSELSRMNATAASAPFQASPELFDVVARARGLFDETSGTFDPTMGTVVRAWGFFTQRPAHPSAEAAAAAKARAGFDKVTLDPAARTIAYAVAGLEIDPGGIGKGYAVDRAVIVFRRFGIASALVSAGGSTIYGIGHPPGRDGWKIAVQDPSRRTDAIAFVTLRDNALSTSGVSEKFVIAGGHRYSHIIDPRTGEPAEGMCQATVVAPDGTASDALTKGAFLLSRAQLAELFGHRKDVHVLRVEDGCSGELWQTPWSGGVFVR